MSWVVPTPPAAALEPLSSRLSISSPGVTLPGNRSHRISCQRDVLCIAVCVPHFDSLSSLLHSLSAQVPERRGKLSLLQMLISLNYQCEDVVMTPSAAKVFALAYFTVMHREYRTAQ